MKKYLLTDSEAGWYKPCGTLDEAAAEVDSVLQLYRLDGNGIYRAVELPEEHKGKDKACTRNGILCGHRRPLISSHVITRCMYILDTGKKRGCPLGRECTRYTAEKCRERDDLFSDY